MLFSINVLLYGDHPDLAKRCLTSLLPALSAKHVHTVRVGLNCVSDRVRRMAEVFGEGVAKMDMACMLFHPENNVNVMKYPLMRRMLYGPFQKNALAYPLHPDERAVMWFDDDSFVSHERKGDWLWKVSQAWADANTKLMGSLYLPGYKWNEHERTAIRQRPWCTDVPVLATKPAFATGGWWVGDLDFLAKWDYPFPELRHNGGDVLLGELCRQQNVKIKDFKVGVSINADAAGKESAAARRGVSSHRPFERPPPYDLSHHNFEVRVTKYGNWWGDNYVDV